MHSQTLPKISQKCLTILTNTFSRTLSLKNTKLTSYSNPIRLLALFSKSFVFSCSFLRFLYFYSSFLFFFLHPQPILQNEYLYRANPLLINHEPSQHKMCGLSLSTSLSIALLLALYHAHTHLNLSLSHLPPHIHRTLHCLKNVS